MKISETKKSNKYVLLATYCFAVVCLLAGLFVPLFNGNGILALQLPDALNSLAGSTLITTETLFALAGKCLIPFGSNAEAFSLDFAALVVILYAFVTLLSLLALIPIGFCFRKETKIDRVIVYAVEAAAVIVLSLYLLVALPLHGEEFPIGFNMLIALGGTLAALVIFSISNKKVTGFAKVFLFILSAVALLLLFDFAVIIPALDGLEESVKLVPFLFKDLAENYNAGGINVLNSLFTADFGGDLATLTELKFKVAYSLAVIVGLIVIINYLFDVISLSTQAKNAGLLFNVARYGLELIAAICLIITVATGGFTMGLFLLAIAIIALIQLAMNVLRYVMERKRVKFAREIEENTTVFARPDRRVKQRKSDDPMNDIIVDDHEDDEEREDIPFVGAEEVNADEDLIPTVGEPIPSVEEPAATEPVQEEAEQIAFIEPAPAPVAETEEPEEEPLNENPDEIQMEIEGALPKEEAVTEPEEAYSSPLWENDEPEVKYEPVTAKEPEPEVKPEPEPEVEPEPVIEPEPEPVAPQPAPAPEAKPEPEPVRTFDPVQRYAFGPDGELIYTIKYGGPSDSFMDKLTNDEKIEFAMTFIERSKGDVGNIPEYAIGGNNKKFFSAVFIYLGRIRGMISDGLLNKMFKELNML